MGVDTHEDTLVAIKIFKDLSEESERTFKSELMAG